MVSKINIGQEIKEKMTSVGIGVTELSNKTHIERRRLYRIFKKKSIDTDILFGGYVGSFTGASFEPDGTTFNLSIHTN